MATTTPFDADKFEILEKIGHGSFGVIRKVRRKNDGKIMCRKEINYVKMSQREREQLHAEFSILSSLRHENIVAYYQRDHLKSQQELHIYMEYCGGGDLARKIRDNKTRGVHPAEGYVWDVLAQLASALYRCHHCEDPPAVGSDVLGPVPSPKKLRSKTQMMILHRDLKPENIFLGADDSIKLGDFGLSKAIAAHDLASTYVGTPYYMSPEICAAERYGWHSDVWAMGCIIYELCQGRPPFDAKTHFNLVQKIKDGRVDPLPAGYSDDLKNLVSSCLQVNPSKRPTTRDIVNLPLVRLVRGQRETLKLGRALKEKESLVNQRLAEAESMLAKSDARKLQEAQELRNKLSNEIREELRVEIDDKLRREWEVKARLEINKHAKAEQERLQTFFDSEFKHRVQEEVSKQIGPIRKSMADSAASSQLPELSSVGTADTPPTDLSANLSSLSFDSPLTSFNAPKDKKPSRTPFSRARTQVDSPMDVQMTSPSPMCASLSLSPRRAAALAGQKNVFTANAQANAMAGRERWQPQLMSDINSEDEDDLPDLPSPTRPSRVAAAKDPFKVAQPPARPAFRRQTTLPANNVFAPQPALFSAAPTSKQPQDGNSVPAASTFTNKVHSPTSPTRRPHQRPLAKANSAAGGEDMFRAVTQKNMFSGQQLQLPPQTAIGTTTGGPVAGRTLVELSQAKAAGGPPHSAPLLTMPKEGFARMSGIENRPAAVWDPEVDEMPSPFLVRAKRAAAR